MKLALSAALLFTSMHAYALAPELRAKASPWIVDQYAKAGLVQENPTILVYMKAEAELGKSEQISSRTDRIRSVFETLASTAKTSQASLQAWLTSEKLNFRSYYISNMIVVENCNQTQFEAILKRDDILRVVGNPSVKNLLPESQNQLIASPAGIGQNLVRIGATKVWDEFKVRGENIVVAGQDTGIKWDHVALKSHYRGWNGSAVDHSYSWHDSVHKSIGGGSRCGYDNEAPCDDHDHGTHTIGTVVGDDQAGNQIGMAPGAKYIGCRNMDAGNGNPEMYTECFQWFLAPWPQKGDAIKDAKPEMAPHVINNSWGCPKSEGCEGGEFDRILKAMKAAGIFVVASAGNEGPGCSTIQDAPAFHTDFVLSVGANDHRNDNIASFSSRGPSTYDNKVGPDVSAPGVNVRSSVSGGGFAEFGWSGTSMAGPHLVGLVALLWSADPTLIGKIDETKVVIRNTSEAKTSTETCGNVAGSARPNNTYGYGLANAYNAVKSRRK